MKAGISRAALPELLVPDCGFLFTFSSRVPSLITSLLFLSLLACFSDVIRAFPLIVTCGSFVRLIWAATVFMRRPSWTIVLRHKWLNPGFLFKLIVTSLGAACYCSGHVKSVDLT